MKRLTIKKDNEYFHRTCYIYCVDKLGKLEDLEEQIETMTLEELVNKVVELESAFETSFDEIVDWLYKNTPVVD